MGRLRARAEAHFGHCLVGTVGWLGVFFLMPSVGHAQAVCPDPIKIGVTSPLTGAIALQGQQVKNGLETAVTEINAGDGISGKKSSW